MLAYGLSFRWAPIALLWLAVWIVLELVLRTVDAPAWAVWVPYGVTFAGYAWQFLRSQERFEAEGRSDKRSG